MQIVELVINVVEGSGGLPGTGDIFSGALVALVMVMFLLGIVGLWVAARGKSFRRRGGSLLGMLGVLTLSGTLLLSLSPQVAFAADVPLSITFYSGSTQAQQSTIAIPVQINNEQGNGYKVVVKTDSSEIAMASGTLVNPSVLENNEVGFALTRNPTPSARNTIANGFDAQYDVADNVVGNTNRFAGLPQAGSQETVARITETGTFTENLYLSVKIAPGADVGAYKVSFTIMVEALNHSTLTYKGNSGNIGKDSGIDTFIDPDSPFAEGDSVTVLSNNDIGFVNTNMHVVGWAERGEDPPNPKYAPGETFEMPAEDLILYAIWDTDTYIHYEANGGNRNDDPDVQRTTFSDQAVPGSKYTVRYNYGDPDLNYIRTGYTFKGWSTNKNATEPDPGYAPGTEILITDQDITLWAVWEKTT